MIGCQRGGDWSRRGSLLTRFKKTSDQVLVLVVVTFDQERIDPDDVVRNGVTEKGKALVVVFSMPMHTSEDSLPKRIYIIFENIFLMACQKAETILQVLAFMFYKVMPKKTDSQWNYFGGGSFKLQS